MLVSGDEATGMESVFDNPERSSTMGYFPFFMDIKGKKGLIVGGGEIAAHKVEKLLPFEASLTVIAPTILRELVENPVLSCIERAFQDEDVEGKMFVIAATDDQCLNAHVAELCRAKNIFINVVDDKKECDFLFPAMVKKGKLTVGVSTEGASPQAAAMLRRQIEQEMPDKIEEILEYLSQLREIARNEIPDAGERARFLKKAAVECMENAQNTPPKND
ncbi:precorrin-2 dehydrogenase/sirohydrochlorin ferrochelatase family protein [Parablautia muri]|uniref:precorrin-2 dehydrogenase n=1 Tax=Parablautia muri TaxID=2320879 RepID=A0A9X5GR30_9FIRM|nr:bifunctional precorrin-2 dehydrogenase/sirohydrochlorin ferrochelatase [Parablautia muri]NBJ91751.1 bifunctional precorrin-2 dehydrogenase/sirohydrochlorin ferrochelatase [Parablautia muri]